LSAGRFITLEGGEGAGKSTQIRYLASWLTKQRGVEVVITREPGGSPGAEAIRGLLVDGAIDRWDAGTEALLHVAARREHVLGTVLPALERGCWVISDRFADSTHAYQGIVQGAGVAFIDSLHQLAVDGLKPDLTLVLDMPVAEGLSRAGARGGSDRYERMGPVFHEKLRAAFLSIAAGEPERCVVIDALGDEETVAQRIEQAVSARWP
jgi:dTMP kinase